MRRTGHTEAFDSWEEVLLAFDHEVPFPMSTRTIELQSLARATPASGSKGPRCCR